MGSVVIDSGSSLNLGGIPPMQIVSSFAGLTNTSDIGAAGRQLLAAAASNSILAELSPETASRLLERARVVRLTSGTVLSHPGTAAPHAYFLMDSVCALVSSFEDGHSVEIGMTGREGMTDVSVLLGQPTSIHRIAVQIDGNAIRIPMTTVLREFQRDTLFRNQSLRFVSYLFRQVAQSAACNRTHLLHRRLCRWLLALHDRIGGREVEITHDAIGQMLGANRSDISRAVAPLRRAQAVFMSRGSLVILDRRELLKHACECYATVHYD